MQIRYSAHFRFRLEIRNIPKSLPETVFRNAPRRFFDSALGVEIAVHRVRLFGKMRDVALVYRRFPHAIIFITIHPLKANQITNRIRSRRWKQTKWSGTIGESVTPLYAIFTWLLSLEVRKGKPLMRKPKFASKKSRSATGWWRHARPFGKRKVNKSERRGARRILVKEAAV